MERYAPLTGVLAVVLWVIGTIVRETAVEMESPATLLDSYRTEEGSVLLGGFGWVLGTFSFFWFLGSLRARLAAAEGGVQRSPRSPSAGASPLPPSASPCQGRIWRPRSPTTPISRSRLPWRSVVGDVFFLGGEMSVAVLLAACGVHALRTGSLPRWLAWVSLVIALALIILLIVCSALLFVFPLWVPHCQLSALERIGRYTGSRRRASTPC